mgnify:FL=1
MYFIWKMMKIRHMERGGGKNNVDTLNKRVYGSV